MNKLDLLAHPISLQLPDRLTDILSWQEHIPFAMFLVDILRPGTIVELGTHAGDSYCAFCQSVSELGLETRCYAVDSWKGDPHSGFYGAEVLEDLRRYHDPRYGSFSRLIQSTFDDALRYFADGSIDLLHIDGYHTYEAVKHDFQAWLPKVSSNGVVILHDTNVREREFGIGRYWEEIKHQFPHIEFLHGHGLGILAIGKVRSREFQTLVEATDQDLAGIRDLFFQLGNRLTLRHAAAAKESMLREKDNLLAEREAELNDLRSNLESRVAELEQRIAEDQEKSAGEQQQSKQRLLEQGNTLRRLLDDLAGKDQLLLEKDGALNQLSTELAEQNQALQSQSARAQERISTLSVQLVETETQLKRITGTLGWRLLSRYGWIKYRYLLPVFRLFTKNSGDQTGTHNDHQGAGMGSLDGSAHREKGSVQKS